MCVCVCVEERLGRNKPKYSKWPLGSSIIGNLKEET